jgi:hypothetical protein
MADDPGYIREFKAFVRGDLTYQDLPAIEAELYGANDRARAVMLGAVTETALTIFVKHATRPTFNRDDNRLLFDFNGPLGTFSAKILVAYAFNLFGPDTRHDLDLIRLLRNQFAHSRKSFNFEMAPVANVCAHLKAPDSAGAFIPFGYPNSVSHEELPAASDKKHPRTRYIMTCHIVADRLPRNSRPPMAGDTWPIPDMP